MKFSGRGKGHVFELRIGTIVLDICNLLNEHQALLPIKLGVFVLLYECNQLHVCL